MTLLQKRGNIMYDFSVPMALMDFVPVAFFGITAVILLGDLYNKMTRGIYGLFAADVPDTPGTAEKYRVYYLKEQP